MAMLSERSKLILDLLMDNHSIRLEEVATFFGVSQRTIKNSLMEIDQFLVENGFHCLKKETIVRYSIEAENQQVRQLTQETRERAPSSFWDEPHFRQAFMYHTLFWRKSRITIEQLEKNLLVSRSTINTDLKLLKQQLQSWSLGLHFQKKKGFYLTGNEAKKRDAYFYYMKHLTNVLDIGATPDEEEFLTYWLTSFEDKLAITLTYSSFKTMLLSLKIIIERLLAGYTLKPKTDAKDPYALYGECTILANYFSVSISFAEYEYILAQIQKSALLKNDIVTKGYKMNLDILVNTIIHAISTFIQIDLTTDTELYNQLKLHVQSSLTAADQEITDLITGKTLANIRAMYPNIYQAVKQSINDNYVPAIAALTTEKQYSFITLHIASSIERLKNRLEAQLTVQVICHMGIGTSQFLKSRLTHYFKFTPNTASRIDLEQAATTSDLLISTTHLANVTTPYIQVTPYLTALDIKKIEHAKNKRIEAKIKTTIHASEKGTYEPMLKELLTKQTIQTNVSAPNWEAAIRYGGSLLEKTGAINERYTNQMVTAVKTYGPYIVIAPGIALAHASAKDGVNRIGISLITLDEGIPFGNAENDPVKIVICLAATDHHTHLKALSELISLLDTKEFVALLLSSTEDEILHYLNTARTERGCT
ncbi:BglG family transcription antiterminator [Enterococcus faecalis]|uniref:BglG family transcription antiterminator n=1 Tax=Enterococcus faecalis TaxID=1351 RepID=UPI0024543A5C|nr:PTS sugar transporter subunit IIA [Enterococcus faecalis]MDH5045326.1 PTS sugar transporter subunit IIA [Enterococcus faecalis]